MRVDPVEYWNV